MVAIVSRAAWGASPLVTPASGLATPSPELWLHHTVADVHGAEGMRRLQADALAEGYVDFEYSFATDDDGTSYEGRGGGRQPAATAEHNAISHALVAFGNFEHKHPSEALIDGLAELVAHGHRSGWWPAQITGPHRDASGNATACCGRNLIDRIPDINARALGSSSTAPGPIPGGDDVPAEKDFVDALSTAEGAWRLQYDGGVETIRGPFHGSYFSLPAKDQNDPHRRFSAITAPVNGAARGYTIHSTAGEAYTFPL
jgi:hypothetical protein